MAVCLLGVNQASSQQIVARQHSYLIIKDSIHRKLSATFGTLVHNIVVYQAGRVKQFQGNCRMKRGRADSTVKARYQQDKNRTHHLTIPLPYMGYDTVEQCIRTGKRTIKKILEVPQFRFNRSSDE
jgi:hypothetical protein